MARCEPVLLVISPPKCPKGVRLCETIGGYEIKGLDTAPPTIETIGQISCSCPICATICRAPDYWAIFNKKGLIHPRSPRHTQKKCLPHTRAEQLGPRAASVFTFPDFEVFLSRRCQGDNSEDRIIDSKGRRKLNLVPVSTFRRRRSPSFGQRGGPHQAPADHGNKAVNAEFHQLPPLSEEVRSRDMTKRPVIAQGGRLLTGVRQHPRCLQEVVLAPAKTSFRARIF